MKYRDKGDSTDHVKPSGGAKGSGGQATGAGAAPDKKSRGAKESKPTTGTPQGEVKLEPVRVARELDTSSVVDAGLVCKCEGDDVDLLLDTGTVSNLVPEDQCEVVHDVRDERAALIGVGGARVTATETGQAGVFGK